jgi:hypothetical protein
MSRARRGGIFTAFDFFESNALALRLQSAQQSGDSWPIVGAGRAIERLPRSATLRIAFLSLFFRLFSFY